MQVAERGGAPSDPIASDSDLAIEPWDYDRHGPLMKRWLAARRLPDEIGPPRLYPKIGLLVDGCVVSFLYQTDAAGVGYLDGTLSDPGVPKERRAAAFDVLFKRITAIADEIGINVLWASTPFESLDIACRRSGFLKFGAGYTCLVRVRKD